MDRAEKVGLGVAIVGHAMLFGALSLGFLTRQKPPPVPPPPINVSLVDKVALDATAPQAVTPPAQSKASELGTPEEAPAAPAEESKPEPAPPKPQPKASPPPKPVPAPAPPQPKKPAAPTPDKAKEPPHREASTAARPTKASPQAAGAGTKPGKRTLGGDLGNVMRGIGMQPSKSPSQVPQAATMSAQAAMDISSKIQQQVQPCANRQVKPGPGAERIRVIIRLKLRRDGYLIGNPEVVGYDGDDDDNRRYLDRVKDNAIATFKGCAPLRDLPQELYDVPRGWSDFKMRYKLPG